MADLSVTYCGVRYPNPLLLASATPSHNGKSILKACEAGIGGIIPKTIGDTPDWGKHPNNGRRDVIEYIMLGASTVQLCTSVMWSGFDSITKILNVLCIFANAVIVECIITGVI